MSQIKIAWDDGTSDYLYLSYESSNGNQSVSITSDLNKEISSRSKVINIKTKSDNKIKAKIIITQTIAGIGVMIIGSTFAIPSITRSINEQNIEINTIITDDNASNIQNDNTKDTSLFSTIKRILFKFI